MGVDEKRYIAALHACALAMHIIEQFDLPEFLQAIDRARAMGPIVDPTSWKKNNQRMEHDAELLRAALPLWKHAKKIEDLTKAFPPSAGDRAVQEGGG